MFVANNQNFGVMSNVPDFDEYCSSDVAEQSGEVSRSVSGPMFPRCV